MRRLLWGIVIAAVLVAVVMGCSGAHRYDARLVVADSLMQPAPDSALALIEALPPDSLTDEGDRAYRDLLLTQARYRCYITATSDSDINRALSYYRAHAREREKLTRAFIYKGAVMEELGYPDSAMYYYKHAEATADKKDYNNLGQINTRIGFLFKTYYADKQTCYDKYEQALNYYRLTANKSKQLNCLYNMGGCSGITHIGKTKELLEQASQLAIELNDSAEYYKCQEMLCRQLYYQDETLPEAKKIALHCLNNYRRYVNNNLLLDLADIYIRSGMPDSAKYYLGFINSQMAPSQISQINTRKHLILSRIAEFEGDTALSNHHDKLAHQVSDSISNNKNKYLIQQIEDDFNRHQFSNTQSNISRLHRAIIAILLISALLAAVFTVLHVRKIQNTKAVINELVNEKHDDHAYFINQLDAKNSVIEQQLINLVELMKQCASNAELQDSSSKVTQQIKETIVNAADDDFWIELRTHLDKAYHGMITELSQHPNISKKDLRFISLCCCGFSNSEIALIMNYSLKYISNKRKNIIQKLGIDTPLQDYLHRLMADKREEPTY